VELDLLIPYDRGELISGIHDHGKVLSTDYEEVGTRVRALVDEELAASLRQFTVTGARP